MQAFLVGDVSSRGLLLAPFRLTLLNFGLMLKEMDLGGREGKDPMHESMEKNFWGSPPESEIKQF